ncbi:hypothetical protein [Actinomadura violacea]|uniref:hypothetical protein n=1 Tax=Actinomadura violacea TaxID=2819934 RepID=UPI001AAE3289|nr:hypothetical protein [Actinomadura violacea]
MENAPIPFTAGSALEMTTAVCAAAPVLAQGREEIQNSRQVPMVSTPENGTSCWT